MSELILYTSEDGITRVDRHTKEGELAENAVVKESLTTAADDKRYKKTISEHIQNLFSEGELRPEATVKESLTVQIEGKREARRTIRHYNLDLILVHQRYENFDAERRQQETRDADAEDLRAIEGLEKELKQKGDKP